MKLRALCVLSLAIAVTGSLLWAGEKLPQAEAKMKLGRIKVQFPTIGTEFEAFSAVYQVELERDAASGLPTGKRQHEPFTIVKAVDKATPMILEALTDGKHFDDVKVIVSARGQGREPFYEYTLNGVQVVGYTSKSQASEPPLEEIAIVFQTITIVYEGGGATHEDNWREQN
jgi:type VI secretion system secreted protein Hcp